MDATVYNLDEQAYTELLARAVVEGRTVGDLISEAIRGYLALATSTLKHGSLGSLKPEPFPEGNENLSSEIDAIVYGQR